METSKPPIAHASDHFPALINRRFATALVWSFLCPILWAVAPAQAEPSAEDSASDTAAVTKPEPVVHLLKLRTVDTEGGMIDPGLTAYVERVVQDADSAGVDALVFDIDTFGGRVDAATVIRDAILDADLLTIAFINNRAISAGALISLACDKIVMVKGGTIGASTPVTGGGEKASDKYVSVMRAEMRGTAERTDRDAEIAEAMVDERIYIPEFSEEVGQPATLTTDQALQYGIADETAESLHELLEIYDLADARIVEIEINWAERVVRLLTHPVVTSLLLSVAIFGLIAEVRTPGWGLGGSLALMALAVFFGSHLIVHLANWEELVLFGIGLLLLFAEIAFIPGFGFAGVAGVVCMLASVLLTRLPEFNFWSIDQIGAVIGQFALSMIGAVIVSAFVLRSLPKIAAFNHLILGSDTKAADGYVSAPTEHDEELVGLQGVTVSELRPIGVGSFDGRRLDIIAQGEFINQHTTVKIISARGSRIVVRAV